MALTASKIAQPMAALVAFTLAVSSVGAQPKPNFSGVWIGRSVLRGQPVPSPVPQHWAQGQPVTITQDDTTITLAYVSTGRSHNPVRLSYRLDGTVTANTSPQGPRPAYAPQARLSQITSSAEWEGTSLLLISVYETPDPTTGVIAREEFRDRLTSESSTTFRLETSRSVRQEPPGVAHFQRQDLAR